MAELPPKPDLPKGLVLPFPVPASIAAKPLVPKPPAPKPLDPAALKAAMNAGLPETATGPKIKPMAPIILSRANYKSICAYGGPRCGKTNQIRALIQKFGRDKVGVIDCERGLASVADLEPKVFVLHTEEEFETLGADKLAQRFLDNLEAAWEYIRTHRDEFYWICIDGATAFSDWVEERGDVRMDKGEYAGNKGGYGMWRDTAREQLRLIRRFRTLPINLYVNSLEDKEREKKFDAAKDQYIDSGVAWAEPALAGRKAAIRYPAAWDLVMRFTREPEPTGGMQFKADTQGDNMAVGGSRIPGTLKLPRYINLGVLRTDGSQHFDPKVHHSIVTIWEAMVGMKADEWIKWREDQKKPVDTPPDSK